MRKGATTFTAPSSVAPHYVYVIHWPADDLISDYVGYFPGLRGRSYQLTQRGGKKKTGALRR